jgi:hypothetical protein
MFFGILIPVCLLLLCVIVLVQSVVRILENENHIYLPIVYSSVSIDGGKTYHTNFASIPCNNYFYICFEVMVKEKNPIIFCSRKQFTVSVKVPKNMDITLHECSYADFEITEGSKLPEPATGTIHASGKDNEKFKLIMRCKYNPDPNSKDSGFEISIPLKKEKIYRKIIVPGFVTVFGERKL